MKREKYLIASYKGENYPFIKITDDLTRDGKRRNIRIDFFNQHHISLHEAEITEEGDDYYKINLHGTDTKLSKTYLGKLPIIFTSKDQNKPKSSWDEEILDVAKGCKLGSNKPEMHREYYENRPLPLCEQAC